MAATARRICYLSVRAARTITALDNRIADTSAPIDNSPAGVTDTSAVTPLRLPIRIASRA